MDEKAFLESWCLQNDICLQSDIDPSTELTYGQFTSTGITQVIYHCAIMAAESFRSLKVPNVAKMCWSRAMSAWQKPAYFVK